MERLQLALFLLVSLAALTAAQSLPSMYNLSSVLSNQKELSTFLSYLNRFPTLLTRWEAGNVTRIDEVLAPSNEAFAKHLNSTDAASNNTDELEAVLTYHVLNGLYPQASFKDTPQFIPTLLSNVSYANVTGGQRVEVISLGGAITFYSAVKATSDLVTSDILYYGASTGAKDGGTGVIHIIDNVLAPPIDMPNTITKARLNGFIALVAETTPDPQIFGASGTSSDWTIFAPNSSQFNLQGVSQQDVFAYEDYHFVHGQVAYSTLLTDGKTLKTLQGSDVTITVRDGSTYVNAAKIIDPDYLISTGVLHLIDSALNPNDTSARPDANPTAPNSSMRSSAPTAINAPAVSPAPGSNLSTGAKVGIGVGAAIGGLTVIAIAWCLIHVRKGSLWHRNDGTSVPELPTGEKNLTTELEGKHLAAELQGQAPVFELGNGR